MESVGGPWLIAPDDPIDEQGGEIATPGRSVPSNTLLEEFRVALQQGSQLCFWSRLNLDFPVMIHKPSGDTIVIIRC